MEGPWATEGSLRAGKAREIAATGSSSLSTATSYLISPALEGFMPATPQFFSTEWTLPLNFRFKTPSAPRMSNRFLKVDMFKNDFLILPLQTCFSPNVSHLIKWPTSPSQVLGLNTLELSLIFFLSHHTSNPSANPVGTSRTSHFLPPPPPHGLSPPTSPAWVAGAAS